MNFFVTKERFKGSLQVQLGKARRCLLIHSKIFEKSIVFLEQVFRGTQTCIVSLYLVFMDYFLRNIHIRRIRAVLYGEGEGKGFMIYIFRIQIKTKKVMRDL